MRERTLERKQAQEGFCLFVCLSLKMWSHTPRVQGGGCRLRDEPRGEGAPHTWGCPARGKEEQVRGGIYPSLLGFAALLCCSCLFCSHQSRSTLTLTNSHRRYTWPRERRVCCRDRDFLEAGGVTMANTTTRFLKFYLEWFFKNFISFCFTF